MRNIVIYVDMDGVLCDFIKEYDKRLLAYPKQKYPQASYGFFESLDPMHNAINAFKFLEKNFNVHILTAPSVDNPLCYTEKAVWVKKHLGKDAASRMVITGHKNLLMGDYLIDDNVTGKGQDNFQGTLIHFSEYDNHWDYVVKYFADNYLRS